MPTSDDTQKDDALEVARDERCIPVARGVLSDILASMTPGNSDLHGVVMALLQRTLDADLNLTTENPYVFQLVLGAYGAFSAIVQKCVTVPIDQERYARIATEIMTILINADYPMGKDVKQEDQEKALEAAQPQLQEIFDREKLTSLEVSFMLEGLFRTLKMIEQIFSQSTQMSVEKMEAKILGIESMSDLTMGKLNGALIADVPKEETVDTPKEQA